MKKEIMQIHNRKEQIHNEIDAIHLKYGSWNNLFDISVNAWPKETADPEAVSDYNKLIALEIEHNGLNHRLREINKTLRETA